MRKSWMLLALPVVLFSCKQSKEDMIAREWQAVELSSPQMDAMILEQEQFLDTFGRTGDAKSNFENYGISNIDSARTVLKAQLQEYKNMQEHAVKNTWFDIRKDGTAVMSFSGQPDSTGWYFNDDGALVLDEMKMKGVGSKIVMDIEQLTETDLKLRFTEDNVTSVVTFKPKK